jgi:site-specific DNA-methyltransferase (adenine-specific)
MIELTGYRDKHEYVNKHGVKSVVYLMDCMDAMAQMGEKEFSLACVDPPFGIDAAKMQRGNSRIKPDKTKNWDNQPPTRDYFDAVFKVSENQIIWGGNYFELPPSQYFAIWDKGETMYGRDFAEAEFAWVRSGGTRIFKCGPNQNDRIHVCQKPIALYDWIFHNYAKPNDTIFDSHLGSGSSRIAADKHNLPFLGTETDDDYFRDHCKRFDRYTAQLTLF